MSQASIIVRRVLLLAQLACLPAALGCKGDDDHDEDGGHDEQAIGTPTGATCPDDDSALTYEDFGQAFMESYCTRCHSSELSGAARTGAPDAHDFDSLDGILLVAEHIDQQAAIGPDAANRTMPPNGDKPSDMERELLGQWLACEAMR